MNKPLLIILSGWSVKNYAWDKISSLLSKDYRIIVVDYNCVESIDDFKKKVINIIEKENSSSITLLGWSLGSLVAQDIALDNLWNIEKIILISATASFSNRKSEGYNIGWSNRVLKKMKDKLNKDHDLTLYDFYKSMFSIKEMQEPHFIEFIDQYKRYDSPTSVDTLKLGLDYLIEKDLRNKIAYITVPILLIHGEKDPICSLESSIYIHSRISLSSLESIPDAGHIPFFTDPLKCYGIISKFSFKQSFYKNRGDSFDR